MARRSAELRDRIDLYELVMSRLETYDDDDGTLAPLRDRLDVDGPVADDLPGRGPGLPRRTRPPADG